jgi:hypothetical protein
MSAEKFCPGPYSVRNDNDCEIVNSQGEIIAETNWDRRSMNINPDREFYNASLLAAAWDLYEALKEAKKTIRSMHGLGMGSEMEVNMWDLYQRSPEMIKINSALQKANRSYEVPSE